jgi:hypothetical protein
MAVKPPEFAPGDRVRCVRADEFTGLRGTVVTEVRWSGARWWSYYVRLDGDVDYQVCLRDHCLVRLGAIERLAELAL